MFLFGSLFTDSYKSKGGVFTKIGPVVPNKVLVLLREYTNHYPISENDFSDILYYRLTHLSKEDMKILDMTEEIFNRIQKHITNYTSFSDFTAQIKTKQYTYSRISRVLLHCLLNIDTSCTPKFYPTFVDNTLPCVPYARLLGFRRKKAAYCAKSLTFPLSPSRQMDLRRFLLFTTIRLLWKAIFVMHILYMKRIFLHLIYTARYKTARLAAHVQMSITANLSFFSRCPQAITAHN